jgi:cytosine/adenosine deaminase-related metal-dependent hydrolase
MSRFFTADQIHDGERFLAPGTVLELDESGRILCLHAPGAVTHAAHFEGLLCPGFVNAHCHLELSHMLGVIPEGTGLIPFLQSVMRGRGNVSPEEKAAARQEAYNQMAAAGVVAVGDIANTTDTLDLRSQAAMHMHTFVECMGFVEATAQARLDFSMQVYAAFHKQERGAVQLAESVVPHAPYSVSGALFRLINAALPGSLISIHNQETPDEDAYYRDKSGSVRELLGGLGIDDAYFQAPGCSSLRAYLPHFDDSHPMLLVHNTCTTAEDIRFAQQRGQEPYWCLCPGANLYIEQRIPDLETLTSLTDRICIGTDSLASNHKLSVLRELRLIEERYPEIGEERLLRWACSGGADALQLHEVCGRFRPGLSPGVLHLQQGIASEAIRIA